jgi:photosystem II stability/assembly factor-like uncharacterized protein
MTKWFAANRLKTGTFGIVLIILIVSMAAIGCRKDSSVSQKGKEDQKGLPTDIVVMNASLFGVSFVDVQHGWAVGKSGTIIVTDDGGKSWETQKSNTLYHLYAVFFKDLQKGWAAGEDGIILGTDNGGQKWVVQDSGVSLNLRKIYFMDLKRGWVAGHQGTLLKTEDGGMTWKKSTEIQKLLEVYERQFLPSLFSLYFSDEVHGYAVGHPGVILNTSDGGATWKRQLIDTEEVLTGVACFDRSHCLVTGANGVIFNSIDGGASWESLPSPTENKINDLVMMDQNRGVAVSYASILSTTDGGKNWKSWKIGMSRWLYSVSFPDNLHGWAVGDSGTVLVTEDGGNTWIIQAVKVVSIE